MKEGRRTERSSKRETNRGRWRGEQKKVPVVLCQDAQLMGVGVPGSCTHPCSTVPDECSSSFLCVVAPAPCCSTVPSEVMLHATLRCSARHKGAEVCALCCDTGPQHRCLFPTDGLHCTTARGSDAIGPSRSCRAWSRVRDSLKIWGYVQGRQEQALVCFKPS